MINKLLAGKLPDLSYHECMYFVTLGFHKKLYSEKYNLVIHIRGRLCYNRQVESHKVWIHALNTI